MGNFKRLFKNLNSKGKRLQIVEDVASHTLKENVVWRFGPVSFWSGTLPWNVTWIRPVQQSWDPTVCSPPPSIDRAALRSFHDRKTFAKVEGAEWCL